MRDPESLAPATEDLVVDAGVVTVDPVPAELASQAIEGAVDAPIVGPARSAAVLREAFGPLVDEDYLAGKTRFRDALCERLGLSELEAEEMCDLLEQSGVLRFVATEVGFGWHLHV